MIAAWDGVAPRRGLCSECGLELDWDDLLNPRHAFPPWFAETPRFGTPQWFLVRLVKTAWKTRRPSRFWRSVRMEHGPSPAAMAACAVLGVLGGYVGVMAISISVSLIALVLRMQRGWGAGAARGLPSFFSLEAVGGAFLEPLAHGPTRWYFSRRTPLGPLDVHIAVLMLMLAVMPLTFALLPQTRRRFKVLPRHVARVGVYSFPVAAALLCVFTVAAAAWSLFASLMRRLAGVAVNEWPVLAWFERHSILLAAVPVLLWMLWWWRCGLRHYLQVPRAGSTAVLLACLSLVAALAALSLIPGVLFRLTYNW